MGAAAGRRAPTLTCADPRGCPRRHKHPGPVTIRAVTTPPPEPDPTLVVSPETVATRAGMDLPLTAEQRDTITDAIRDAQADVEAYLGRSVVPRTYTQVSYAWPQGWVLDAHGDDDVIRILSTEPVLDDNGVPTNYFTVTYLAGLDAAGDEALRPIRRFITVHALNSPEVTRLWQVTTGAKGDIRSVSAEGQSVSWSPATLGGGGAAGSGNPGALPTLASLDRWRVAGRRVYQGPTRFAGWPLASMESSNRDWYERNWHPQ